MKKVTDEMPPYSESPVWYEVKYKDGTMGVSCFWWDHWYCNALWMDIVEWGDVVNMGAKHV